MLLRPLAAAVAGVLLGACGGAAEPAPSGRPATAASPTVGVLEAFSECPSPPAGIDTDVEGLTLPEGSVVTKVTPQKPLVNVNAYVPMTPVEFENAFQGLEGVTILFSENEIFEAELLISNGSHRNFYKATATCRQGSTVLAVVAPEVDAKGLPLPAGATATPAP